ncbi:MAG: response regulator [Anaerolineae bacterium]|nr:response regulator [Anaerolineae bacterium]
MDRKVLVVDDEPQTVELIRLMFKTLGHEAEGASTGAEAISAARRNKPLMVLLDVMLPDMSGYDVCTALKAMPEMAGVPVIMLTALDDRTTREKALNAGADTFVAKPVSRAQLRDYLDRATAASR